MQDLRGRVAIVTGVSRRAGIGFAIAKSLAQAGAKLFLQSWSNFDATMPWGAEEKGVVSILDDLAQTGVEIGHLTADFSHPDSAQAIMDTAVQQFGHVDIVVANHAYSVDASLETVDAASFQQHLMVNAVGTFMLAQAHAKQHDGRKGGRFIMMSSGQGISPMEYNIAYAASKAAIEGMTLTLSAAMLKHNIMVNTIDPGATDTGWADADLYEAVRQAHPQKRWGTPEDAARLVTWLVSDEAAWITGQIIRSRGGLG